MDTLIIALIVLTFSIAGLYLFYPLLLLLISSFSNQTRVCNKKMFTPRTSIIVATYNEETVIRKKLENLLAVTYPRRIIEIIIVDSGSADHTREIVREYKGKGVILIEQPERLGKASAINLALERAKGEIIVLSDANSEFQSDSLEKLLRHFDDETGAVLPRFVPSGSLSVWDKIFYGFHHVYKNLESMTDSVFIVFGEMFAFRKSLVTSINEKAVADDLDIAMIIRKKQFRIKYAPNVAVKEKVPVNAKDVRIQKTRHVFGILQTMIKNIDLFGNSKFGYYGRLIFPIHFIQLTIGPFLIFAEVFLLVLELLITLIVFSNSILFVSLLSICLFCFVSIILFRKTIRIFSSFIGFLIVQLSILSALFNFARKKDDHIWQKISSTR